MCRDNIRIRKDIRRGEGLTAVDEWMETMDPDENKIYKFLGVDSGMRIKMITQWYIVHE